MDTTDYSKWGGSLEEIPGGHWGCWGRRFLLLTLALLVTTVLWALILSILLSKASSQHEALLGGQDLLRTNASKQTVVLDALKQEVGACNSCCLRTQAQLKTAGTTFEEVHVKLIQLESSLKELSERVTQSLAEAGRDREDIRSELFRELEAVRLGNSSCEQCPTSWLPFRGSCYLFSVLQATWEEAQRHCAGAGAHLVIVGDLDEQGFLTRNTRGLGYWLGLRAVRRASKVQGYQWVDGVPLSFSYWNLGEPNDSQGHEDCIMMLRSGSWNDAPCHNERDNWICEKRLSC
ncbi:C-type lectin domain family 4 member G-like [Molossus molossus]|uniref:C-type lectin domain family 4 member G n=1 Tax=Molossus molossus TaxID=27622 RepID=A0A7J8I4H3_MOLMO|nr:C-type lectin domain family 4 member G-like [Molossus molossus]KAF6479494.1 C-type lectin domain family 4 member G [Molossus molossus]